MSTVIKQNTSKVLSSSQVVLGEEEKEEYLFAN